MTDSTTADANAQAFADARPVFEENFLADRYELLGDVRVQDEFGGWTTEEGVVETDRCLLDVALRVGREGGLDVATATGPFIAELPVGTIATADHRIRITAATTGEVREFAITSPPKRGGGFEVFTRLELELRSRSDGS